MTLRIFTEPQQGATYDQLLAVALTVERLGFGAFFRSDHYLKMGDADGLPATTDAWITLAGLARDTSTIRLGTLVTPVTFRAIGSMAVVLAQVDQMSGGRIDIGLGAGWFDAEHTAFGLRFPGVRDRYDLLDDQLSIITGLWSTPPGQTFTLEGATTAVSIEADTVRPAQTPHPPIILGGQAGPRSALLTVAYADEYNAAFRPLADTKATHDKIRAACDKAGRDPGSLVYSAAQVVCCGADDAEVAARAAAIGREVDELRENGLAGTPQELVDKIAAYSEAGVERFYLQVLDLADLEHLDLIATEVMPHVTAH